MVFLFFSILLWPTIHHYNGGVGYKGENPLLVKYEQAMLGNMGYSSMQCATVPLDLGSMNIKCPYGSVGKIFGYGVNRDDDTAGNCVANDDIEDCKPTEAVFRNGLTAAVGKEKSVIQYVKWQDLYSLVKQPEKQECYVAGESRLFAQYSCE